MSGTDGRIRDLEMRLQRAERERKQYWPIPPITLPPPASYLWTIVGGNTLPVQGIEGILRAAVAITPSTLPDGPAGTGIVAVPPWPIPTGLPAGIGVAVRVDQISTGQPIYTFVRIDGTYSGAYGSQELAVGESVFLSGISYLDKVVGPTTWRYSCLSGIIGYY